MCWAVSVTLRCWGRWITTLFCSWMWFGVIRLCSSSTVWTMLESVWNEPRTASRDATESSRAVCSRSRSEKHLEHLNTELHITHTCVFTAYVMCFCLSGSHRRRGRAVSEALSAPESAGLSWWQQEPSVKQAQKRKCLQF